MLKSNTLTPDHRATNQTKPSLFQPHEEHTARPQINATDLVFTVSQLGPHRCHISLSLLTELNAQACGGVTVRRHHAPVRDDDVGEVLLAPAPPDAAAVGGSGCGASGNEMQYVIVTCT